MAPRGRTLKCMTRMSTWMKFRTSVAVALVQAADHLDEALLTSLYLPLSRTLGVTPTGLGGLSMARSLVKVRRVRVLPGKLPCGLQRGGASKHLPPRGELGAARKRPAVRRCGKSSYLRTAVFNNAKHSSEAHSWLAVRVQSLASPAAGVLGDRCNRMYLIVAGTACWAVFTLLFGFAHHYAEVRPSALRVVATCYGCACLHAQGGRFEP